MLLKNATIIDKNSSFDGKKRDVLIEKGLIKQIASTIKAERRKVIDLKGAYISIGWLDLGVHSGEPGFEHREDFQSLTQAAAAGGYTGIVCFPNTQPTIQSKTDVQFIKSQSGLVDVYPIGAVSKDCEGKDLAELYDMQQAGCVAFSDGNHSIQSSGLMKRGLEYVKSFKGLVINHPNDEELAKGGQLNEGAVSTALGMKGLPNLAEELMLKRDLELLAYTDSRLHVHNISTEGAVQLIREAKKQGLPVTASVPVANLIYDQGAVATFNTHFKVLPPLRQPSDIKALIKGLKDGTIDCITSNHTPLEEEAKKLEFLFADFGMIGLETAFALLQSELSKPINIQVLLDKIAYLPRKILGISIPSIEEGERANLTLFSTHKEWIYEKAVIQSKSKNSPFIGKTFKGQVLGIVNGNRNWFSSSSTDKKAV